jgi:NAD(P)H-hydrate epimerase
MPNYEETASRLHLSAQQSRSVDRFAIDQLGLSSLVLMENAGRRGAEVIYDTLMSRPHAGQQVTILIGPGNNGGDGWVIARHLEAWGVEIHCILVGSPDHLSPDNEANFSVLVRSGLRPLILPRESDPSVLDLCRDKLRSSSLCVDALLGTGSKGTPREPLASIIRLANETNLMRIAIDLPSGLDADSGVAHEPTFRADRTVTMVTRKLGFQNPNARQYLGDVIVIPIGIPASQLRRLVEAEDNQID